MFTLGSDTVFQRLAALQSVPEFTGLARHPRVLRLVHHQRKACSRLVYLQDMKVKCASLHILSSTQVQFERWVYHCVCSLPCLIKLHVHIEE